VCIRTHARLDLAFHAAIVTLLDSSGLDEFYAELTSENPEIVLAEHEAIVSAIRSGERLAHARRRPRRGGRVTRGLVRLDAQPLRRRAKPR
jgi:DNA-binding FadR family transcriptional regulator